MRRRRIFLRLFRSPLRRRIFNIVVYSELKVNIVGWPEAKVIIVVRPEAGIFERGGIALYACPLTVIKKKKKQFTV